MLGDLIGDERGPTTGRRVLPGAGGPTIEISFASAGKFLGVDSQDMGTYTAVMRPDGTLFGEGQGVIMGAGGEMATWKGQGVGRMGPGGAASWRGAIYYQSPTASWARINSVAGVFEYEVDAGGNTTGKIWEWK